MKTAQKYTTQSQRHAAQWALDARNAQERTRLGEANGDFWYTLESAREAVGSQTLSRTYYQRARQVMGLEE
jgi:hypothetical protein